MIQSIRNELERVRLFRRRLPAEDGPETSKAQASARVLCIASGKGGTGKSVMATNIAHVWAERGQRVLLVDFDAGMANAHLLVGVAGRMVVRGGRRGRVQEIEAAEPVVL